MQGLRNLVNQDGSHQIAIAMEPGLFFHSPLVAHDIDDLELQVRAPVRLIVHRRLFRECSLADERQLQPVATPSSRGVEHGCQTLGFRRLHEKRGQPNYYLLFLEWSSFQCALIILVYVAKCQNTIKTCCLLTNSNVLRCI